MTKKKTMILPLFVMAVCAAQNPSTDAPYTPQPILPGGVVMALYPPGSPFLNKEKVREAEQYNMSQHPQPFDRGALCRSWAQHWRSRDPRAGRGS
jgi:hypothetical protein